MKNWIDIRQKVTDKNRPELIRALDLFEFQCALFVNRNSRRARLFCAMKLLEHENSRSDGPLKSPGVEEIIGEIIQAGLLGLRKMPKDKSYDKWIAKARKRAEFSSDVIDFLRRYNPDAFGEKATLKLARYVVRKGFKNPTGGRTYIHGFQKSTSKKRWSAFKDRSILIYLLLHPAFDLAPARIATKKFAARLLSQVRDIERINKMFRAHDAIMNELVSKKVRIPSRIGTEQVAQGALDELAAEPFGEEIEPVLAAYDPVND